LSPGTGVDRSHVTGEEAGASLRFVDSGDAAISEAVDHVAGGTFDILDDDAIHGILLDYGYGVVHRDASRNSWPFYKF
jgi:hypothetical protein